MSICIKQSALKILLVLSALLITWLTTRYFPVEPDVANSPIVWRHILENGISSIHDWKPTVDNWYFTVYPINFLFYMLLGDDGLVALRLSTAVFSIAIVIAAMLTLRKAFGFTPALFSIILLSLIPYFSYTYGFVSHPFSHNSTNAFGFLCLLISVFNIQYKNIFITLLLSLTALFSSVSDPWFTAAFFIPLLISYFLFSVWDKKLFKHTALILFACLISLSNVLQNLLNIPPHQFEIVSLNDMILNAKWCILLIGKSLNLLVVDNNATSYASFVIWFIAIITSAWFVLSDNKKNTYRIYIVLFSLLSIAGIVSSFILSYKSPDYISMRFFMNVTCFALILCCIGTSTKAKILFYLIAFLFSISSIKSYTNNASPLHDQEKIVKSYIDFLKKNNLHYGYGSFWDLSMTVNWLSGGDIQITPVFFNADSGKINFTGVRQQTLASWHSKEAFNSAPERQFIAVSIANEPERCKEMTSCLAGIQEQLGKPDEVLNFEGRVILVFNKKLNL
ncbi:TPA: hypothetical protein ACGFDW_003835 [Escherichia coli]